MATLERDILDKVGKYNLQELSIISYSQDKEESKPKFIDIKGITLTLSITEDIFNNSLSGNVVVYDMQDIRTIFPLTGLERLSLKLNTPGLPGYDMSEDTGIPFHIYKVDQVRKDPANDKGQFYKIYFCSPEMINNTLASVSKAYSGPIEDAVEDVFRQQKYLNSKKQLFVENTSTNAKYVIPSLKPYQCINYLSKQATSGKYNNAGYLFYETAVGYHFRSLASLYAQPISQSYTKYIAGAQVDKGIIDIEKELGSILDYEIVNNSNKFMPNLEKISFISHLL